MSKVIIAGLALCGAFATLGQARAYVNYPWCIVGETRGIDCVFSTFEQCAADGRSRGFGSQCRQNPAYNPALGHVVGDHVAQGDQVKRPTQRRHKPQSH